MSRVCLSAVQVLLKCVHFYVHVFLFRFCLLLKDVNKEQVQCTTINSKQRNCGPLVLSVLLFLTTRGQQRTPSALQLLVGESLGLGVF